MTVWSCFFIYANPGSRAKRDTRGFSEMVLCRQSSVVVLFAEIPQKIGTGKCVNAHRHRKGVSKNSEN